MPLMMRIAKAAVLVAGLFALAAQNALAQEFPTGPVTLVVPFSPGGQADVMARLVQPVLAEKLGVPVVVENRPGAGGMVGTGTVYRSAPDGHTIMFCSDAVMVVAPLLNSNPGYVPEEMTPLTVFSESVMTLYVKPDSPIRSVADMIAYSRENPDKLSFGSSGTALQIVGELINQRGGARMKHIPYPGAGQVITDVVGGHVGMGISALPGIVPYLKSDTLRVVAVTSSERTPSLPDVETVAETVDGVISEPWTGFFAPGGVPQPVVDKLNAALVAAFNDPVVRQRLDDMSEKIVASTAAEASERLRESKQHWTSFLADVDIPRQ